VNHYILTQTEKEICVGSYLGDGSILEHPNSPNKNCYMQINHTEKQKDYLEYKYNLMINFAKRPLKINRHSEKNTFSSYCVNTVTNPFFRELRNSYTDRRKSVQEWMLPYISPIALAIWYMDDGDKSMRRRTRKDGSKYEHFAAARISLGVLSESECNLLVEYLQHKYDISGRLHKEFSKSTNRYYTRMYIPSLNAYKLFNIISPFVPESMQYKIDYSGWKNL
jgi:recombination protein RecA